MTGMQAGSTVFTIDGGPMGTIEFGTTDDARRLRELLERRAGESLPITLGYRGDPDSDVEGHAMDPSVALTLQLDGDDTTGHAISVRFPTADDAARFRRNMILAGALAASVALGSAGAIVISGQAGAPADSGIWQVPVYERPAGRGMLQGEDLIVPAGAAAGAAAESAVSSIDPATGRPMDRGFLRGVDGGISAGITPTESRPAGSGPLEGVDE